MSARREDRWQGLRFECVMGRYALTVTRREVEVGAWDWDVRVGACLDFGIESTERAAKLAARRCAERLMREGKARKKR